MSILSAQNKNQHDIFTFLNFYNRQRFQIKIEHVSTILIPLVKEVYVLRRLARVHDKDPICGRLFY
jgi:hypothetical protein